MDLKQKLSLLTVAALLSCSTTYAKRDYNQYPEHKAEIALYNLQEIAKDRCSLDSKFVNRYPRCESMNFDENKFEYNYRDCVQTTSYPTMNGNITSCKRAETTTHKFYWNEIVKIVPGAYNIKICTKDNADCTNIDIFSNEQQAYDFAEALNIYRKSKKEE